MYILHQEEERRKQEELEALRKREEEKRAEEEAAAAAAAAALAQQQEEQKRREQEAQRQQELQRQRQQQQEALRRLQQQQQQQQQLAQMKVTRWLVVKNKHNKMDMKLTVSGHAAQLPSSSKWGQQAPNTINQTQNALSLAEIQKLEEERERLAREEVRTKSPVLL